MLKRCARDFFIKVTLKDNGLHSYIAASTIEGVVSDPQSRGSMLTLKSGRVRVIQEPISFVLSKLDEFKYVIDK